MSDNIKENTISTLSRMAQEITDNPIDINNMTDREVSAYRSTLLAISKASAQAISKTSRKDHNYDDGYVREYINQVLDNGVNKIPTKLSVSKYLADAQHLTRWKGMIKECVQDSGFKRKGWLHDGLRMQRSAIEQSSTLHTLRQSINLIVGPLNMIDEHNKRIDDIHRVRDYPPIDVDRLCRELDRTTKLCNERGRVIDEMIGLYSGSLPLSIDGQTLSIVDEFKLAHRCSDGDACRVLGISRRTVTSLRSALKKSLEVPDSAET